jgi:hypothetical protein
MTFDTGRAYATTSMCGEQHNLRRAAATSLGVPLRKQHLREQQAAGWERKPRV